MFEIKLTDNDCKGKTISLSNLSDGEKSKVRKALNLINNVSLKALEAKGLLVFNSKNNDKELTDENTTICSVLNLESDAPVIKTKNIMGFFSLGNIVHMEITSRFDKDENQFFLHYMLQKVCDVLPVCEQMYAGKNHFHEYLVYLFPAFLKKAVNQGIFRTYITRNFNDSNIRGVIDIPRHIKHNIPFNGKIAYRTREYSQDNYMTQLIRHTIESISENTNQKNILFIDKEVVNAVEKIRCCTESYSKTLRDYIVQKNSKPVMNPFYTEYESLRKLCLMILSNTKTSFNKINKNQIYGILFNGASLWEEYLNSIMKEKLSVLKNQYFLEHPNNRIGKGMDFLFENEDGKNLCAVYPDFMIKDSNQEIFAIVDAKYKFLNNGKCSQEDYFQVLSYMFRFNCKKGIIVYPKNAIEEKENITNLFLKGYDKRISFKVLGLNLPDIESEEVIENAYKKYCNKMYESERKLLEIIFE